MAHYGNQLLRTVVGPKMCKIKYNGHTSMYQIVCIWKHCFSSAWHQVGPKMNNNLFSFLMAEILKQKKIESLWLQACSYDNVTPKTCHQVWIYQIYLCKFLIKRSHISAVSAMQTMDAGNATGDIRAILIFKKWVMDKIKCSSQKCVFANIIIYKLQTSMSCLRFTRVLDQGQCPVDNEQEHMTTQTLTP